MMRKTRRKDAEIGKTQRKKHDANAQKSLKHAMQKINAPCYAEITKTRCKKRDEKTQKSEKRDTKTRRKRAEIAETRDANAPYSYVEIVKTRCKKRDEKTQKSTKRDAQNTMQTRRNR